MVFFLNLIFSVLYCDYISKKESPFSNLPKIYKFFPIIIIWSLICGSQFFVGTDYPSYIAFFNGQQLERLNYTGEYGFIYFIKLFNSLGIKGQAIYFIIYFISFLLFYQIIKIIPPRNWGLFILLFIVTSTLFNNQLNIVRQSFSIYLGSVAALLIYKNQKFKGLCLIILASSFHTASFLFVIFFLFRNKFSHSLSEVTLFIILTICILSGDFIGPRLIESIKEYLPPNYAWHINSGNITEVEGLNRVSKYIFVPFYYLSILSFRRFGLSSFQNWLFNWGIIGFAIRMLLLNMQIVNRVSFMFLIISVFPLLYYFNYLKKKNNISVGICYGVLIVIYAVKVLVLPSNEYDYDSILFHIN